MTYKTTVTMEGATAPLPSQVTSIYGEPDDFFPDFHSGSVTYEWHDLPFEKAHDLVRVATHFGAQDAEYAPYTP